MVAPLTRGTVVALAMAAMALSGCAVQCGASDGKLAALRRGMSYDEASRIMGCSGTVVSASSPSSGDPSMVEWDGPGSMVFRRTLIGFANGQLVSYTTQLRGAL
jgi:hypothetical protein